MKHSRFFIVLCAAQLVASERFSLDCDGCWCVPEENNQTSCPPRVAGITHEVPERLWREYASFQLRSDPLRLTSANGEDCYPFKERFGPFDNYDESSNPPCRLVDGEGNAVHRKENQVCAYKFLMENNIFRGASGCCGRSYVMKTYDSKADAFLDGAVVHHVGACGVCSTARDFAARSKAGPGELVQQLFVCTAGFYFAEKTDFSNAVRCFMDWRRNAGFTEECAKLHAHYAVSSAFLCLNDCIGLIEPLQRDNETIPLSGCDKSSCSSCRDQKYRDMFADFAGYTPERAGVIGEELRACNMYYPVIHESCTKQEQSYCNLDHLTSSPTALRTTEPTESPSERPSWADSSPSPTLTVEDLVQTSDSSLARDLTADGQRLWIFLGTTLILTGLANSDLGSMLEREEL